jgi:hypothetical protein
LVTELSSQEAKSQEGDAILAAAAAEVPEKFHDFARTSRKARRGKYDGANET